MLNALDLECLDSEEILCHVPRVSSMEVKVFQVSEPRFLQQPGTFHFMKSCFELQEELGE